MAAPASEDLRELERELVIAAEAGETRQFASLRDDFGMGHEDLEGALATLREHGKAVEAAPGEWRGPLMDEMDRGAHPGSMGDGSSPEGAPRVQVHVGEDESEPAPTETALTSLKPPGEPLVFEEANVRLTRAIADALDAQALGSILKAGLSGLDDGESFTLEVLP